MRENQLIVATWGLVLATFLLVVATAIPALASLAGRREEKRRIASQLIPTLHLMKNRMEAVVEDLLASYDTAISRSDPVQMDKIEFLLDGTRTDLEDLERLLSESRDIGLTAVSDLFVANHLVTQAQIELEKVLHPSEQTESGAVKRTESRRRVCRLYQAAIASLTEAESQLPKWSRNISGENFWHRFDRLSREREDVAEKEVVEMRHKIREKQRSAEHDAD